MKTTRVSKGYYTAEVEMKINGEMQKAKIEICHVADEPEQIYWYILATFGDNVTGGDDTFKTKRAAVEAAEEMVKAGLKHYKGLGWCLAVD